MVFFFPAEMLFFRPSVSDESNLVFLNISCYRFSFEMPVHFLKIIFRLKNKNIYSLWLLMSFLHAKRRGVKTITFNTFTSLGYLTQNLEPNRSGNYKN